MRKATRADWAAYALFLILPCVLLWPVIFQGEALLPLQYVALFSPWQETLGRTLASPPAWNALQADSILQYLPWRHFAHESLRAGFLPLWNSHQFCGTPFLANYQSAVFYPLNLLFWVLPAAHAFGVSAILHLFLAGAFVYAYLRGRGVDRGPALLGGIAFELSGFTLAWLELPTAVNVVVWLPLALHLYERSRQEPGPLRGVAVTLPLAMVLLAGHPQFAFYALLAFVAYALARAPEGLGRRRRLAGLAFCAGAPLALAAMLAAAQILPMVELSRLSHRGGGPLLTLGAGGFRLQAVPAAASVLLFAPGFFGNLIPGASLGPVNRAEVVGYVGVLPLLLTAVALLGLLFPSTRGRWRAALPPGAAPIIAFLAALTAVSVAASFRNPAGEWVYRVVPGLGRFGSPGRMLCLSTLGLSLLAGFAAHALARQGDRARLVGMAAALVALAAASLAFVASGPMDETTTAVAAAGRFAALLALSAGVLAAGARLPARLGTALLAIVLAGDLFAAGWGLNPTAPASLAYPPDPALAAIQRDPDARFVALTPFWGLSGYPQSVLPPNAATACGLRDVNGYDSLYGMAYKGYLDRLAGGETSPPANGNMVLFAPRRAEDLRLLGCRYLLSPAPVDDPGLELVSEGSVRVYRLRGDCPRAFAATEPEGKPVPGSVSAVSDVGPTRVDVSLSDARGGWLVLLESYFPGWRAEADGVPVKVERAREVFRAVRVPAGTRRVAFRYQPGSFRVGLFLSLAGLALLVAAGVARGAAGTKRAAPPDPGKRRDEDE